MADREPLQERADYAEKSCSSYCVFKVSTLIFTILYLLIGVLVLCMGTWMQLVHNKQAGVDYHLETPALLAIVIGVFAVVTAICGLIGAGRDNIVLLRVFLAILIVVFIFQVTIGVVAFVYREQASEFAAERMQFAIKHYHSSDAVQNSVNYFQKKFRCCGIEGPSDWDHNSAYSCFYDGAHKCSVPNTCCRKITIMRKRGLHTNGCMWFFIIWLENHLDIIGAVVMGFAIPQIIGMYLVFMLSIKIDDKRKIFNYRRDHATYSKPT